MKTHNEHSHKSGSFPARGFIPEKQSDWWKHNHPNEKMHDGGTLHNSVKTGLWKTYSAKNPGNKK